MIIKKQTLAAYSALMVLCMGNASLAADLGFDNNVVHGSDAQIPQNFSVRLVSTTNDNGVSSVVFEDVVEHGGLYALNAKVGDVCADIMLTQQEAKLNVEWYRTDLSSIRTVYEQERSELFPNWADDNLVKLLYAIAKSKDYSSSRFQQYKILYADEIRVCLDQYRSDSDYKTLVDAFVVLHYKHATTVQKLERAEERLKLATSDLDFFHGVPSDIQAFLTAMNQTPNSITVVMGDSDGARPHFVRNYVSSEPDGAILHALADKYRNVYPYLSFDDFEESASDTLVALCDLFSKHVPQFDTAKLNTISAMSKAYDYATDAFDDDLQKKKRDLLNTFFLILKTFSEDKK